MKTCYCPGYPQFSGEKRPNRKVGSVPRFICVKCDGEMFGGAPIRQVRGKLDDLRRAYIQCTTSDSGSAEFIEASTRLSRLQEDLLELAVHGEVLPKVPDCPRGGAPSWDL